MSDIKLVFEYDGKRWTAEPAPYVKLPDGTQLKVIKSDADGNAEVKLDGKKGVQASDASEIAAKPAEATGLASLSESAIVAEWQKRNAANDAAQRASEGTETALREVESVMASRIIAAGKNAVAVLPGGIRVKARNTVGGARLARIGEQRIVALDAPAPPADAN